MAMDDLFRQLCFSGISEKVVLVKFIVHMHNLHIATRQVENINANGVDRISRGGK